jgi:hypothetical protein
MSTVTGLAGSAALGFISGLVEAKESGQDLPPVFDTIANLAITGKNSAQDIAIATAKEESRKQLPWILFGIVVLILVVVWFKK